MLEKMTSDFGRGEAPWLRGGRGAQTLHFLAANGFPLASYNSFLAHYLPDYQVIGLENRGMWGAPPSPGFNWSGHASDLIAMLAHRRERGEDSEGVIAIGHSIGGTVSAIAASQRPELFKALLLIDPAAPPGRWLARLPGPLVRGVLARHRLVTSTRARGSHWASAEEFTTDLLRKGVYRQFRPEALQEYVDAALEPDGDGGFALRYDREWEAQNFLHTEGPWPALRRASVPTLVLRAQRTFIYSAEDFAAMSRRFPSCVECGEIPGVGHMAIQEGPEQVLALVQAWLQRQGLGPTISAADGASVNETATDHCC